MTGRTRSCRTSRNRTRPIKPMPAPRRAKSWSRARSSRSTCRRRRTRRRGWCRRSRFSPIRIPVRPAFRVLRRGPRWLRAARLSRRPLRQHHRTGASKHSAGRTGAGRYGRRPKAPRPHPLAARRRLGRARRHGAEKGPHGHHPNRSDGVDDSRCLDRAGEPSGAPAQAPLRTAPARAAMQQARPAPAPRAEANGPLSIVPDQDGAAPAPARTRTALARPTEPNSTERAEPAPSAAGGGYAVQVTSQRSEADAQAEFRTLRDQISQPASAAASRSSGAPILAPKASITARWSAPLPRRTRRPGCVRA